MTTPKGTLMPVLTLRETNNKVMGTLAMLGNPPSKLTKGQLKAGRVSLTGGIKVPVPARLTFDVKFDGDTLSGTCANSLTKPFPVTGSRIGDAPKPMGHFKWWKDFLFGYPPGR